MIVNIPFGGLSNSKDRKLVGLTSAYSMQNVNLDHGILEAETGLSVQIPASGVAHGLGFGTYLGTEEYLAVLGSSLYKAAPSASSWTQVATGLASGEWLFQTFGERVFAVNQTDGLCYFNTGGAGWRGTSRPPRPDTLGSVYEWGLNWDDLTYRNSIYQYGSITANWTASGDLTGTSTTLQSATPYNYTFRVGSNITGKAIYTFKLLLTVPSTGSPGLDWSHNDRVRVHVKYNVNYVNTRHNRGTLRVYAQTSSGSTLLSPIRGTEAAPGIREAETEFYFLGAREARESVTKLIVEFQVGAHSGTPAFQTGDTFTVGIWMGDVWQNNGTTVNLDQGAVLGQREYAYSTYKTSTQTESDLGLSVLSASTPSDSLGSFTRVALSAVASGLSGSDFLKLYRKRKSDGKWVYIGQVANTGDPWYPPDRNPDPPGSCYVDDKYMEWELDSLSEFEQPSNLPIELHPQSIGVYNNSLCLGIGSDLYISKVNRPTEYETPGDPTPDADDYNAGRFVFVDSTRSQYVNMIVEAEVLYLGTNRRSYFTNGDFPKDLPAPRLIDNNGPIGYRSFAPLERGNLILNSEGLWLLSPSEQSTTQSSTITSVCITDGITESIQTLSPSASSLVVVQRGDVIAFSGNRYLRRSRVSNQWTEGTLGYSIHSAIPDGTYHLRLLTTDGALLKWAAGSAMSTWSYQTGEGITARARLKRVQYVSTGQPSITVNVDDGARGTFSQTYMMDEDNRVVQAFEAAELLGTVWSLEISGTASDKVHALALEFEVIGGGSAH